MNVSAELLLPVLEEQAKLADEEDRRWSLSFVPKTAPWTITDMKDAVRLFQKTAYKENIYDEELIVESEADSTIFRVQGVHNISMYCEYENPRATNGKWYKYSDVQTTTDIPDIFSLKIGSHIREEHPQEGMEAPSQWAGSMKNYEIRKRIVYTDPKTDVLYILSMVKRTVTPSDTMLHSGVGSLPPVVEYSIECPPKTDPKEVVVSMVRMLQILEQNSRPITMEQRSEILAGYDALVNSMRDMKHKYNKKRYYLAPKPVTLEQVHLSDPGITYGQLSILEGYAVTDKADGERMLLFVSETGDAYMINSAFEVRGTGWRVKRESLHSTILDGEYLPSTKRLDKSTKDMFAVFDAYFVGGESVMHLPLMKAAPSTPAAAPAPKEKAVKITGETRVDVMNSVLNSALWEHDRDTSLELVTKVHTAANGNDMFAACRKILEDATKKGRPYDIDGLIFTPADLPVFGYYPNTPVAISQSATWDRVLKWKPPSQNSIDFGISMHKNPVKDVRYHRSYAKVTLTCGYSALRNEEVTVGRGLQLLQMRFSDRKKELELVDAYIPRAFTPQHYYERGIEHAYVPIGPDGIPRAENGDEITDGAIVEFGYDKNDKHPISYRWRALRVRHDKMRTAIDTTSEDLSKNDKDRRKIMSNDWKTATSIWRSIHEPVSREMITGVARAPQLVKEAIDLERRLLGTDAIYYGRTVARYHLLSVEMLNLHGLIKEKLYKYPQKLEKNNLLELACGKAGDLNNWQDPDPNTGFSFRNILGVDMSRDNITNPIDGAYVRVFRPRYWPPGQKPPHQNYVFVIGDCSKPLRNGSCSMGIDDESVQVLRELYDQRRYNPKQRDRGYLRLIQPFAAPSRDINRSPQSPGNFDMVSCQFAIHYFFKTEQDLKGFMANVRDNLRPGGLFITTFMDGASVEKHIRDKGNNGLVEGRKLGGKVVVWAIRRIRIPEEEDLAEAEAEQEPESDPESEQDGGGGRRKTLLEVYEPDKKTKKTLHLVNVPALGDCMFIALELSAYGEEKSPKKDGMWMREHVIEKMREVLSKNDEKALDLYESIELHIRTLSPSIVRDAKEEASGELLDSEEENYAEKAAGYLKWMKKRREWGTQIELRGAMYFLERPIYIYQTTDDKTVAHTIGDDLYPNNPPVRVWFNGEDHYKALLEPITPEPSVPTKAKAPAEPKGLEEITQKMKDVKIATPTTSQRTTRSGKVYNTGAGKDPHFGRLIDVYLENINRLTPEYLVDFQKLVDVSKSYGLELVESRMFSEEYHDLIKKKPELLERFSSFDKDPVQQAFSFLNRWAVFRRM